MPLASQAQCSRPIHVPMTTTGFGVIAHAGQISGIVPDFLSELSAKTGCQFVYTVVPKNRQENLFELGKADLLVSAVKTAKRNKLGVFVPLVYIRPTLISIETQQPPIQNARGIFRQKGLRLIVVRGYDYGSNYQAILDEMKKQGRLSFEPDPLSVARTMKANPLYATIMAPTIFAGVVMTEPLAQALQGKIRFQPLEELPWTESGIYISKTALSQSDQESLKSSMARMANTDIVWRAYQHYYPPEVLKISLRPREAGQ